MKVKLTGVVMMVVLALTGCQDREKSADLTGSYGVGVVTGQVVAAEGVTTPEGVEVSVRGTGMRTVLAADGQFAFASMPENATLDFRRADGVQAALLLDQASGHLVIELTKSEAAKAKKGGRRRAARTGERLWEFEGVIRSAGAGSFVMFTSKQVEQTIGLLPETVIRKGNTILTPADLLVDTRIHVKARKVDETTFNALLIIVQDEEDDDAGEDDEPAVAREYEGTVVSAGAAELVVFTSKKVEVTFILNADTVIRKGNTPVLPEEIQAGWRVHVKAAAGADGTTLTATRVTIQKTR